MGGRSGDLCKHKVVGIATCIAKSRRLLVPACRFKGVWSRSIARLGGVHPSKARLLLPMQFALNRDVPTNLVVVFFKKRLATHVPPWLA